MMIINSHIALKNEKKFLSQEIYKIKFYFSMSIHQRSLSTHSNRDLITKFSSLNHTLNTQTTPRAKPSHRLPEKMNSTSMRKSFSYIF